MYPNFEVHITTKNRKDDLVFTLNSLKKHLENGLSIKIIDDASNDGTFEAVQTLFPKINLQRNSISKGLIYNRNLMLNNCQTQYAISLDDDANFLTENVFENIENYFQKNPKSAVLGFRVYWSEEPPKKVETSDTPQKVKGYVGCGHVWRIASWKSIPNYPDWFVFYGEEEFASYQLFKNNLEIHYLPSVLVHHRVDIKARKTNTKDYTNRLRHSLRSGWFLMLMFYPLSKIPRLFAYSIFIQLKNKVFKGDLRALKALTLALFDLLQNLSNINKTKNRLSNSEFDDYKKLPNTKLYWKPNN